MSDEYGGYTGRDRCINCGGLLPNDDYDWNDVEAIIEDLKRDGYTVGEFTSNTSEPKREKAFLLVVERDE